MVEHLKVIAVTLVPSRCRAQGSWYDLLRLGGSHMSMKFSLAP